MRISLPLRALSTAAALALLAAAAPRPADAQIGGLLRGAAGRAAQHAPGLASAFEGEPPISTAIKDAVFAVDSLDNFTPRESFRSMMQLQRTPNGGFVMQPGAYEMQDQSYCLHAGTHGPTSGDGYLYAPLKGPANEAVSTILRNSVQHPEIDQHGIQTLLWAIVARAKFNDLSNEHKAIAARLLTPRQLATLNRSALDLVPGATLDNMLNRVPEPVRQALRAEAQLRQMLTQPGTSFEQLERVAVLAGMAPMGAGSRSVPAGRWSLHPDGFYVRYYPAAYYSTHVQIWVPQGSPAVGREFDPSTMVATPANTAKQRLVQSARPRTS
jgi:hypothetical protein